MGQLTQTTAQVQVILDDADAANVGKTSLTDSTDTTAVAVRKSGFYSLGASSSNAPSTDRAILISAVRDTTATGEIRYGQVAITESNGMWWNRDDGGVLGTWYEAVSTAGTQTLTNKTLTSPVLTTPQINDSSADHQYVFAVSELVADRTVTLPLLTGNDTFVFEAHTQTLTNKTLTSPVFNTGVSGSAVLDDDTFATASSTTLATSESIKAYVDATVTGEDLDFAGDSGTGAVDLDSQTFTIAGTANEIETAASSQTLTIGLPDSVTITTALSVDTINEKTAAAGVTVDSLLIKDGGITAGGTSTFAGQTISDLGTVTTANIDGGSIDGTTIGASTAAAGTFTTGQFSTSLNVDGTVTADGLTVDGESLFQFSNNGKVTFRAASATDETQMHVGTNNSGALNISTRTVGADVDRIKLANNGDISFYEDTGTTAKFFWDASAESLGIGTASPDTLLHLYKSGNSYPSLRFERDDTTVSSGNVVGRIEFEHQDATNAGVAARMLAEAEDGSGSVGIAFETGTPTSITERMRISADGNVGIGATSPQATLQTKNTSDNATLASASPSFSISHQSGTYTEGNYYSVLGFAKANSNGATLGAAIAPTMVADGNTRALTFSIANGGGSITEAMRIDSSGHLRLGSTANKASLRFESTAQSGFSVGGGFYTDFTQSTIEFQDSNTTANYKVRIGSETDDMVMFAGGSERLRIDSSGNVGIGTDDIEAQLHVYGQNQATADLTDAGASGATIRLSDNQATAGSGGAIVFANSQGDIANSAGFAAIKGLLSSGAGNTTGQLAFSTRNLTTDTALTERMRIDASGNLLVGATDNAVGNVGFKIAGSGFARVERSGTTSQSHMAFTNGNGDVGSIYTSGTGTNYNTSSDRRLKTDIQPIINGTQKLMAMKPVSHKWIADPNGDSTHGFIAQEMQEVFPEAVSGSPEGETMMSMDYGRITPIIVAALQDAHNKIEILEARLADLEKR